MTDRPIDPLPNSEATQAKGKTSEVPLGLVPVPTGTFERDVEVADRYHQFSAEMLRLALLGIAGVGFLLVELDPAQRRSPVSLAAFVGDLGSRIRYSLVCFGLSAGMSLAHRYISTDSLAFHLRAIRLRLRASPSDVERVKSEEEGRGVRFTVCRWLLGVAALLLALGAGFLASGFYGALDVYGSAP